MPGNDFDQTPIAALDTQRGLLSPYQTVSSLLLESLESTKEVRVYG